MPLLMDLYINISFILGVLTTRRTTLWNDDVFETVLCIFETLKQVISVPANLSFFHFSFFSRLHSLCLSLFSPFLLSLTPSLNRTLPHCLGWLWTYRLKWSFWLSTSRIWHHRYIISLLTWGNNAVSNSYHSINWNSKCKFTQIVRHVPKFK